MDNVLDLNPTSGLRPLNAFAIAIGAKEMGSTGRGTYSLMIWGVRSAEFE